MNKSTLDKLGRTARVACRRGRLASTCLATLLTVACATNRAPRVIDVDGRTYLQDIDIADTRDYYGYDMASRFHYVPRDLPIEDQREEYLVSWAPASITLVKFEYRQVAKPVVISEKTFAPRGKTKTLFEIRGEDFRAGGSVSAWRVTLWEGDRLVAEKRSFLW